MPRVATLDHSRFISRASTRHAQFLFVEHRTNLGACVASICSFLRVPMMRQCHSTNRRTSSTWPRCASTREKTPGDLRTLARRDPGTGSCLIRNPSPLLSLLIFGDLRISPIRRSTRAQTDTVGPLKQRHPQEHDVCAGSTWHVQPGSTDGGVGREVAGRVRAPRGGQSEPTNRREEAIQE